MGKQAAVSITGNLEVRRLVAGLLALMLFYTVHADSPHYPMRETLYPLVGDIGSSILHLTCLPHGDKALRCDSTQITFIKPEVRDAPTDIELDSMMEGVNRDFCENGPFGVVDLSTSKMRESQAKADPEIRKRVVEAVQFCNETNPDARRAFIRALVSGSIEVQRQTCRIRVLPKQTTDFAWNHETQQWRSIEPGTSCGAVTVTTIESKRETFWNFSVQTMITDPEGQSPMSSTNCSEWFDGKPMIWASQGDSIRQNCQIIGEQWTQ